MKKYLFVLVIFGSTSLLAFAQEKTPLSIINFTNAETSIQSGDVNSIQQTVIEAFVKTKRFVVIGNTGETTSELAEGTLKLEGHIISIQKNERKEKNEEDKEVTTYTAKLSVQLKITNAQTGEIVSSETINSSADGDNLLGDLFGDDSAKTPEQAIDQAIVSIGGAVGEFVNTYFPATFYIVEISNTDKKGKASELLIAGGTSFGLKKGDKLKVVQVREVKVGNKTLERKKEIGEIRVKQVEDENFSICVIRSGGDVIKSSIDQGQTLLAITKQ
ncbi:hypothetical protein [Roseivirga sp. E12]|uniref:hypothetical protein n=1 Tax=Roseivirga sp. E12 TaxID=2819237 RepID=UPI001ABBFADE|nr:hypothetical protein [Roseivirga sp. E12]MBO3698236.1 hypothetical protein [Roseivirga sp. E12]